jgi:hypothetical protein
MPDYKKEAIALWKIIDDIDTYSNVAKDNDVLFRNLVERKQSERHTILSSDGYSLFDINGKCLDFNKGTESEFAFMTRLPKVQCT